MPKNIKLLIKNYLKRFAALQVAKQKIVEYQPVLKSDNPFLELLTNQKERKIFHDEDQKPNLLPEVSQFTKEGKELIQNQNFLINLKFPAWQLLIVSREREREREIQPPTTKPM